MNGVWKEGKQGGGERVPNSTHPRLAEGDEVQVHDVTELCPGGEQLVLEEPNGVRTQRLEVHVNTHLARRRHLGGGGCT